MGNVWYFSDNCGMYQPIVVGDEDVADCLPPQMWWVMRVYKLNSSTRHECLANPLIKVSVLKWQSINLVSASLLFINNNNGLSDQSWQYYNCFFSDALSQFDLFLNHKALLFNKHTDYHVLQCIHSYYFVWPEKVSCMKIRLILKECSEALRANCCIRGIEHIKVK